MFTCSTVCECCQAKDPLYATTGPEIWKVTGARKYLNEQNRTLILVNMGDKDGFDSSMPHMR
ncbi:hypothetical protein YC2023_054102 [Brassica napus]